MLSYKVLVINLARSPERLAAIRAQLDAIKGRFDGLKKEALLANPLLDFDELLVIRRRGNLGLPQNWQGNCALPRGRFDNEIAVLSPVRPGGKMTTLYKPETDTFVGDVDLHFDADRMLFSSIGTHRQWQIFEIGVDSCQGHLLLFAHKPQPLLLHQVGEIGGMRLQGCITTIRHCF